MNIEEVSPKVRFDPRLSMPYFNVLSRSESLTASSDCRGLLLECWPSKYLPSLSRFQTQLESQILRKSPIANK